jgi:hypothetical protein
VVPEGIAGSAERPHGGGMGDSYAPAAECRDEASVRGKKQTAAKP